MSERVEHEFVVEANGVEVCRARFAATFEECKGIADGMNLSHWPAGIVGYIASVPPEAAVTPPPLPDAGEALLARLRGTDTRSALEKARADTLRSIADEAPDRITGIDCWLQKPLAVGVDLPEHVDPLAPPVSFNPFEPTMENIESALWPGKYYRGVIGENGRIQSFEVIEMPAARLNPPQPDPKPPIRFREFL